MMKHSFVSDALGATVILGPCAQAATPAKLYVLTSAPRESAVRGQRDYGPIAAFLTKVLHHAVVYRHPDGWLTYERWIWKDRADVYI